MYGCSATPLTDYINNPIYQELIDEDDFFGIKIDEGIYLDLRASSGYTNEAEKLERNTYSTKSRRNKKTKAKDLGSFHRRISIHISKKWINSPI